MSSATPTILLLIETSRGYGRGLLRGVIKWRQLHGPCHLLVSTGHFKKRLPENELLNCDGMIATITSVELCRAIGELEIPTIITEPFFDDLAEAGRNLCAGMISADHHAIVSMACDYFIGNQYENIAFCGIPGGWWSRKREKAFVRSMKDRGLHPWVYPCPYLPDERHRWEEDSPHVARWLHELPKPVSVLTCNDDRGRHLLRVCHQENIAVPQEIAVLGVDNDDLECELTQPPLSSIALNVSSTGFSAMQSLMEAIAKRKRRTKTIYDVPSHIVERHSTGMAVTGDPYVDAALRFIRTNFIHSIQVVDTVKFVGISRRSLEARFKKQLGHTMLDEIRRQRCERAKQLLLHTNDSAAKIAITSGFENFLTMLRTFQDKYRCSPSEYRSKNAWKSGASANRSQNDIENTQNDT